MAGGNCRFLKKRQRSVKADNKKKENATNDLTDVEKQFVSAIHEVPEDILGFDPNNSQDRPLLRQLMQRVAFHEAGHFAARLFTDIDLSQLVDISIIPENGTLGRLNSVKLYHEPLLQISPLKLKRMLGRILLLEELSGYGAEVILYQSEGWETIADYCTFNDDYDDERSDFSKAFRIALLIEERYMPVRRILILADRWTLDMLRIPALWSAVETMASTLIKRGKITNVDGELADLVEQYHPYVPKFYQLKKWNPRLCIRPAEEDKCVSQCA
jgi:hypothetical protein